MLEYVKGYLYHDCDSQDGKESKLKIENASNQKKSEKVVDRVCGKTDRGKTVHPNLAGN